jgi:hypothetical protein
MQVLRDIAATGRTVIGMRIRKTHMTMLTVQRLSINLEVIFGNSQIT